MHIDKFCKVIQIIILSGYNLDYYNLILAFPDHLDDIISIFENNVILAKNENTWIKDLIEIYHKHKLTRNDPQEIKSLSTSKFDLICYDHLNIRNKFIDEIYFCDWIYFNYSIAKVINNNKILKFYVSSGRLGHRFEMYDLNKFLLSLNPNVTIKSFGFADMENLDFNLIFLKLHNLETLYLNVALVYRHDKLIPLLVSPVECRIQYQSLTTLSLQNFCTRLDNDILFKLMGTFPNLISLSLRYSEIEDNSLFELFSTSKQITTLKLDSCQKLSSDILHLIPIVYPCIETLHTTNMSHVNDQYVIHILRNCKVLKEFEIDPITLHNNDKLSLNLIACVYKYLNKTWISHQYSEAIKNLSQQEYFDFLDMIN